MPEFRFYQSAKPHWNIGGNLPHWRQDGATYFITFRLADSLPHEKLQQWRIAKDKWLLVHPFPHDEPTHDEYVRRFIVPFEGWLDAGAGQCVLGDPRCKEAVEQVLREFDHIQYTLDEFVVMPNHVHVLVMPNRGEDLSLIVKRWKGASSRAVNQLLKRQGTLWQRESFDHLVRSPQRMEKFRKYIQNNPVWWRKQGPKQTRLKSRPPVRE